MLPLYRIAIAAFQLFLLNKSYVSVALLINQDDYYIGEQLEGLISECDKFHSAPFQK